MKAELNPIKCIDCEVVLGYIIHENVKVIDDNMDKPLSRYSSTWVPIRCYDCAAAQAEMFEALKFPWAEEFYHKLSFSRAISPAGLGAMWRGNVQRFLRNLVK